MGDQEGTLKTEYDDISMKIKLNLTRFGGIFGRLTFDKKSCLKALMGFTPFWDYKPTNTIRAETPGVYISEKILYLITIMKFILNVILLMLR